MMSKRQDPVVDQALGDTKALFPPSSASVPDAALTTDTVSTAVLMKQPVFWPDAAEVWFAQVDAQCAIHHVSSSKTKFYHAVAVLPQEVASQILNLPYSQIISLSPTPFFILLRHGPPDKLATLPTSPSLPVILS